MPQPIADHVILDRLRTLKAQEMVIPHAVLQVLLYDIPRAQLARVLAHLQETEPDGDSPDPH